MPLLANAWGLAARVQGRERYYALMFDRAEGGRVRLVKRVHDELVLASERFDWQLDRRYRIELRVAGTDIEAHVDGKKLFSVQDTGDLPLTSGAVALVVDSGSISAERGAPGVARPEQATLAAPSPSRAQPLREHHRRRPRRARAMGCPSAHRKQTSGPIAVITSATWP